LRNKPIHTFAGMAVFHQVRLTSWAIGLSVGAGIYALIGDIAKVSGNKAPLMFACASFVMLLNGYVLGSVARRFPHAGSILAIVQETTHPWVAMAFEILRLVEGGLALCVTAKLTVKFAYALAFGLEAVPPSLGAEAAFLVAVAFLIHRGLDTAMDLGNVGTAVEVAGLLLVIGAAVFLVPTPSTTVPTDLGLRDATRSITQIVFAFGGIQGVLDMAGDVQDAEKVLPRVVMLAVFITGLLYTSVCYAALSIVGVESLAARSVSPLGMVLERVGFPVGTEQMLAFVSLLSVGNTCMGIFTFVSRIALSLARHVKGDSEIWPPAIYLPMVFIAAVVGHFGDVFSLAGRVGVMLLVTFVVVDYAFLAAVASSPIEQAVGMLALFASCGLALVDQCM